MLLLDTRKGCWDADSLHIPCFLFFHISLSTPLKESTSNILMPLWIAKILLSLWGAAKNSLMLAIRKELPRWSNTAQLICFTQGARTIPHYSSWLLLVSCRIRAPECAHSLCSREEQQRAGSSAQALLEHPSSPLPWEQIDAFLLPRRQPLLLETVPKGAQSILASLRSWRILHSHNHLPQLSTSIIIPFLFSEYVLSALL